MNLNQNSAFQTSTVKKKSTIPSQKNLQRLTNPLTRIRTSPSKNILPNTSHATLPRTNETSMLSKSFTASKEKTSSRLKSPKQSQPRPDYLSLEGDYKLTNLQLQMDVKDLNDQLSQLKAKNDELEGTIFVTQHIDQLQCLKELTMFQRQTIEQQKSEGFEANSRFWKIKSELTQKESTIDQLTQQFRKQQVRVEELEELICQPSSRRRDSTNSNIQMESEIKRLSSLVKEYKKELNDQQKKLQQKDHTFLLNKELKEKLHVVQEVNDLLREQLKRSQYGFNDSTRRTSKSPSGNQQRNSPESEIQLLRTKVQLLEKNEQNLERVLKEKQTDFSFKERILHEKINKLEQQVEFYQKSEETDVLRTQIGKLTAQITSQSETIVQLTNQLQSKKSSSSEISQSRKEVKKLQLKLEKVEKDVQQKQDIKQEAERDNCRTPQRQRNSDVTEQQRQITRLNQQATKYQDTVSIQSKEIKNLQEELRNREQQDREIQVLLHKLQLVQKELNIKLDLQEKDYEQQLKNERELNEKHINTLNQKLKDKEKELSELQIKEKELQGTIQRLTEEAGSHNHSRKVTQTKIPNPHKNSDHLLYTSSEEEDEDKLKKDIGYYKKEFEDLLVKYQEHEDIFERKIQEKDAEIVALKAQIRNLSEQTRNRTQSQQKRVEIPELERYQQFLNQDKSSLNTSQLVKVGFESEQHRADIHGFSQDLDSAMMFKLESLQQQLLALTADIDDF